MKVTPLDLKKADFKRVIRGFDPGDVSDMMAAAAETLEDMVRENRELKEKVNHLTERLKIYELMEHTLNETLITAQKAGDSTRQAAERESELIVAKAEVQAEKLVEEAKSELKRIRYQIEMLEHEKEAFLVKMRSLVASQWKLLQEDFEPRKKTGQALPNYTMQGMAKPVFAPPAAAEPEGMADDVEPALENDERPAGQDERDFGNLSDKLGKILGSRKDENREADKIDESEVKDSDAFEMSEDGEESQPLELDNLPRETSGGREKPDVFWGDEQQDEAEEKKKRR